MLTIGIVLLVVGALIALVASEFGRDRALRLIGLVVAVIGVVVILLAVLPADANAAAMGFLGLPFLRRFQPARQQQIDPGFALALAGQVAVGVARSERPGDDYERYTRVAQDLQRAQSALATIGIMVLNACDDPVVQETLRTDMEVHTGSGMSTLRLTTAPKGTFAS